MTFEGNEHPLADWSPEDVFGESVEPNISFWSQVSYWTAEEAVALSFGMEPHIVNWRAITSRSDHEFRGLFRNRREIVIRAMDAGDLKVKGDKKSTIKEDKIHPSDFIKFAKAKGFAVPGDLEAAVSSRGAGNDPDLDRSSAPLKMLLGMAMHSYGYKHPTKGTSTVTKIKNALELRGISIDEQSIRDWLLVADQKIDSTEAD